MGRRSQQQQPAADIVQLVLTAPKGILPGVKMIVQAPLDETWYDYLSNELELRLTPDMYICTARYLAKNPPGTKNSWRCEITDKIRVYTEQFERHRKQFAAHIRRSYDTSSLTSGYFSNSSIASPATPRTPNAPNTQRKTIVANSNGTSQIRGSAANKSRLANIVVPLRESASTNVAKASTSKNARLQSLPQQMSNLVTATSTDSRRKRAQPEAPQTEVKVETPGNVPQNGEPKQKRARTQQASTSKQAQEPIANDIGQDAVPQIRDVRSVVKAEAPQEEEEWNAEWEDDSDEEEIPTGSRGESGADDTREPPFDSGHDDDELSDDCDDNASLFTAVTAEEHELRREGIQVEDIKSLVEQRVPRFSNPFMLRVRNEIKKLKENNMWDRNVNRSPLACYLLQEMFKDSL